jgi:hypothetical protein
MCETFAPGAGFAQDGVDASSVRTRRRKKLGEKMIEPRGKTAV